MCHKNGNVKDLNIILILISITSASARNFKKCLDLQKLHFASEGCKARLGTESYAIWFFNLWGNHMHLLPSTVEPR